MNGIRFDAEEFVATWVQACEQRLGRSGVLKRLGITEAQLSHRVTYLRQNGVDLPPMKTKAIQPENVSKLNAMIKKSKAKEQ